MLIGIIKLILLWWIITVAVRWYRRLQAERIDKKAERPSVTQNGSDETPKDRMYSGKIEDAEFEDINDWNRSPRS